MKPGDVMQKKNMWEVIGDSSGQPGQRAKVSTHTHKYEMIKIWLIFIVHTYRMINT